MAGYKSSKNLYTKASQTADPRYSREASDARSPLFPRGFGRPIPAILGRPRDDGPKRSTPTTHVARVCYRHSADSHDEPAVLLDTDWNGNFKWIKIPPLLRDRQNLKTQKPGVGAKAFVAWPREPKEYRL